MTLLDRHIAFLEALRGAGLPVSLSEDLDAVTALGAVGWSSRTTVRDVYAATVVKRQGQRATFDQLFELYFPRLVGEGAADGLLEGQVDGAGGPVEGGPRAESMDNGEALAAMQEQILEALAADDVERLRELAAEAVGRFGSMPGRGPGLSSWSSYTALRRLSTDDLTQRLAEALRSHGWTEEEAERAAGRRTGSYVAMVEADARRRIAEEKGPEHIAQVTVRPTIDRLDFLHMRRADVEELRRELYPLARRMATRLAREQRSRHRGPLDFRRTVRASMASGGVPITTHHKPKRPHRSELVVLCDVSGSVANFATFTLMLVFALREVFTKVRAFTFVDDIVEVTDQFRPGADLVDVMTGLVESSAHAARMGRTNYGRALTRFVELHGDALTPKSSVLILGDARSNYADLALPALQEVVDRSRHQWWLNPEVRRQWDTGDSAASRYAALVPMVECRNLVQLQTFIKDLA
ncbi:VWA domain-containing protein [Nocardioides nematodiphilus]|uniref:VWA domain-containing protein n=1 Tax=Nocardioides nematodiphilus TaxID=2849669 RepID=UPI001CD98286|nr:VWA domain-containing protein [Nocardioides nematodiphilus]MCA1981785.1 VWA domain-containing protein [Nocardioides nematodiphilus]